MDLFYLAFDEDLYHGIAPSLQRPFSSFVELIALLHMVFRLLGNAGRLGYSRLAALASDWLRAKQCIVTIL